MIRFGLLGAGRIGQIHAANIARHPKARLVAVSDVNSDAAGNVAEQFGADQRPVEAILASSEIDAVVIATPAETHAELVERSAAAGKAIFCEKPLDRDLARTQKCLRTVEASGVSLFMAFNRRFDPSFAALRERLRQGEIGRPEMIFLTSRDPAAPPLPYIARSGGLFRDMMVHDFDVARWLIGEHPEKVFAVGGTCSDPAIGEMGFLDTAVVTMTCPSGTIININCAMRATYGYDQRVEVHGSLGKLSLDNRYRTSVISARTEGIVGELPLDFFADRYADAYVRELDHFVDCLMTGKRPGPDGKDGLAALILAEAAHRSWRTGLPVRIDDIVPTI
jgi:myo-inositol 2-dehydrogenase / D-chiro-inositol 1-dehydrogenase